MSHTHARLNDTSAFQVNPELSPPSPSPPSWKMASFCLSSCSYFDRMSWRGAGALSQREQLAVLLRTRLESGRWRAKDFTQTKTTDACQHSAHMNSTCVLKPAFYEYKNVMQCSGGKYFTSFSVRGSVSMRTLCKWPDLRRWSTQLQHDGWGGRSLAPLAGCLSLGRQSAWTLISNASTPRWS